VGSDPVSVSGDLCGVLDGAVYIGDNFVSETLNPQITYQVDFSFLGPYQGDRLSKIWLGDCSDESSAELKWTNLSVATSSSSDSGSAGTSSGSSGGGSSQTTSTPTPTSTSSTQEPAPTVTPSSAEVFTAWFSTIQASFVSEKFNHTSSQYLVELSFTFEPYPLSRNRNIRVNAFTAEGGGPVSLWEASFGVSLDRATGNTILAVDEEIFKSLSSFVVAIHDTANPGTPVRYLTVFK
jgi:hypothetical protein